MKQYALECGFLHCIAGTINEAQEQHFFYALVLFYVFLPFAFLSERGDTMHTSSFENIIRLQFDSLIKLVIRRTIISYYRELTRRSKHEKLFYDMSEFELTQSRINDQYPHEYMDFYVLGFVIHISNEQLGNVLKKLTEQQRNVILMFYFLDMSDVEIAKLIQSSRSAVYRNRKNALILKYK